MRYIVAGTGLGAQEAVLKGKGWEVYTPTSGILKMGHGKFKGIAPNQGPIQCGCKLIDYAETYLSRRHFRERYGVEPNSSTPEINYMVAKNFGKALATFKFPYAIATIIT